MKGTKPLALNSKHVADFLTYLAMDRKVARSTKGNKDRETLLPESLVDPLKEHLIEIKNVISKLKLGK